VTTSAPRTIEPSLDPPVRARRSIIIPGLRPMALTVLIAAAGALVALSIAFHNDLHGTALDNWLARNLVNDLGSRLRAFTLHTSDQHLTTGLLVLVVLAALAVRRWDVALFATAAPLVAIFLTEVVLKPAVNRTLVFAFAGDRAPGGGAFPSGHETGLATLTVELAVLALRAPVAAGWRALVVAVLAAWTGVGALGLTANLYHYATDTLGGVLVAIVTVLGIALLVDGLTGGLSSPAARNRPRTSPAA
jgi:undecaprenyl-diphosphatase